MRIVTLTSETKQNLLENLVKKEVRMIMGNMRRSLQRS